MNELILDTIEEIFPQRKRSLWSRLFSPGKSRLAANFKSGGIFDQRYTKYPYDKVPPVLFFYYLKFDVDGALVAREYRYFNKADPTTPDPDPDKGDTKNAYNPIEYKDLETKVAELVKNARNDGVSPKPHPIDDFQDMEWKFRCHMVIFFDEDNWNLLRRKNDGDEDKSPVLFLTRKNYKNKLGHANHTFFEGANHTIQLKDIHGNKQERYYFSFVNHMKQDDTGQTEINIGEEQYFSFNILIEVSFSNKKNPPLLVIFDPGGTNLGPPLKP